jgi:hypothetical protein
VCGIAGKISFTRPEATSQDVPQMLQVLRRRGPDSEDLGVPNATNGFQYPCKGTGGVSNGMYTPAAPPNGCRWMTGAAVSGDNCGSSGYYCGDLLRRDFSGGTSGNAIVLLRPASYRTAPCGRQSGIHTAFPSTWAASTTA